MNSTWERVAYALVVVLVVCLAVVGVAVAVAHAWPYLKAAFDSTARPALEVTY